MTAGKLYPKSRVKGSIGGKLLRGHIEGRKLLANLPKVDLGLRY